MKIYQLRTGIRTLSRGYVELSGGVGNVILNSKGRRVDQLRIQTYIINDMRRTCIHGGHGHSRGCLSVIK